jgi:tRNA(Ile)-lysidine synthase
MTNPGHTPDSLASLPKFAQLVANQFPAEDWLDHSVVVAVSGGADSVALLRALHQLALASRSRSGRLLVAHVDHGLRGRASDDDRHFVVTLAETLGLESRVISLSPDALRQTSGVGLEAAARTARYRALHECAHQAGARFLATGHTWDDQVETVLFRLLRGTGIAGLSGIRPLRPLDSSLSLVRPLVSIRRSEVLAYLEHLRQTYCRDATNRDPTFTRNWIRHELLPLLRSRFPGVDDAVSNLADVAADYRNWAQQEAGIVRDRLDVREVSGGVVLRAPALSGPPEPVVQMVLQEIWRKSEWPLRDMGNEHWRRLTSLARRQSAELSISLPGRIHARLVGDELWITAQSPIERRSDAPVRAR